MIPTFSPQGDGNKAAVWYNTKTSVTDVDPYLFPARGRKRGLCPSLCGNPEAVDPYLFPARGRKLYAELALYHGFRHVS